MTLAAASTAGAWSHEYVHNQVFWTNNNAHSGYNWYLNGNAIDFTNAWGGTQYMGSRYIDTNGFGENAWDWRTASFIDWRWWNGYAAAQCWANPYNTAPVYVYQCYTDNN